jgi:acetyl esterase
MKTKVCYIAREKIVELINTHFLLFSSKQHRAIVFTISAQIGVKSMTRLDSVQTDRRPAATAQLDIPVSPLLAPAVAAAIREASSGLPTDATLARRREWFSRSRDALGPDPLPAIASVREETIRRPEGLLRLRLYRPSFGWKPVPALLFFHGGGWTLGDLDSHDKLCRQLAAATGHVIVAVDYRLAPEHPWPAALEDGWTALEWLIRNAPLLAIDPTAIGVAGDSAGGNIAAVLAIRARDRRTAGTPPLKCQVLIYPCLDLVAIQPSHLARAEGFLLNRADYLGYVSSYIAGATSPMDPEVSPLRAVDLSRLPPTVLISAEFDPLLDEGRVFAGRLAAAGVPVFHRCHAGMVHGFITMGGRLPAAGVAIADLARALAAHDLYGFVDGAGI